MGLLKNIWKWLTTNGAGKPRKAHPDLYPIDVERIAKDLGLAEQAKRLGEAGLPAPDAAVITGPEAAVVQRVEKARQDYVDWGALRLNVLDTDLGRRNVTAEVNRACQADKEFERKASALLSEQDADVRRLGQTARKRTEELEAFRTQHGLVREAHDRRSRFYTYSALLALIALEALANARFFAQGMDSGLVGGFTEAGIMAAVNVFVAFCLGKYAVPYVNHRSIFARILGVLGFFAAIAIMCCVALGIAHYRDSLTAEAINPAAAALEAFQQHPLQLKDFFSWGLFAVSLIFGLLALFDGLFSDDRYPGYGAVTRRTQLAIDDHEAELDSLRKDLEQLKNDELAGLDAALARAQADVGVFESLINDKRMAGSRLSNALSEADYCLDALLKMFRTENEVHRNGVPRPNYFDTHPDLKPLQLPDFTTDQDEEALRVQTSLVSALVSEEQNIRARIQAAFTQQFDRLQPLNLHFPSMQKAA